MLCGSRLYPFNAAVVRGFSDGWRCDFYSCISQLFRVFVSCTRSLGRSLLSSVKNKREKVVQERGRIAPQRPSVRAAIVCYCFTAKFTKS